MLTKNAKMLKISNCIFDLVSQNKEGVAFHLTCLLSDKVARDDE